MPANSNQLPFYASLQSFFSEIDGQRTKAAADNGIADPGGHDGPSTHPSADRAVAEHLHAEQTGSRFSEHTTDVKEDVGAASIENLPEEASSPSKGSGNQDERQPNVGVRNAATGEDHAAERDFKATKDDPGTTSVMKADDGEKYASWGIQKLASYTAALGNEVLADVAVGRFGKAGGIGDDAPSGTHKVPKPGATDPAKPAAKGKDDEDGETAKEAAARGYNLAASLGGPADEDRAAAFIEAVYKEAALQGDLVGQYLVSYHDTLSKRAGEDGPPGADEGEGHEAPGDDQGSADGPPAGGPPGGGGGPPAPGGQDPMAILSQLPPEVLQQLVQALQGGGMGGGAPTGPAAGGPQGPPPGMGGEPPMGPDEVNDQLAGGMDDVGVGPDDLEGMASKAAARITPAEREELMKVAADVRKHRRSGKYDGTKRPASKTAAKLRGEVREWLADIVGRAG